MYFRCHFHKETLQTQFCCAQVVLWNPPPAGLSLTGQKFCKKIKTVHCKQCIIQSSERADTLILSLFPEFVHKKKSTFAQCYEAVLHISCTRVLCSLASLGVQSYTKHMLWRAGTTQCTIHESRWVEHTNMPAAKSGNKHRLNQTCQPWNQLTPGFCLQFTSLSEEEIMEYQIQSKN